jgi:hypothetical protein
MALPNRPSVQARNGQFVAGIAKRLQTVPSVAIAGATYTPAELVALFQSLTDKADAVATAQAKLRDAFKAYRDLSKELVPVVGGFRHAMRNLFGAQHEALSDFGIAPPKASKPSLETKVTAAEKSKATRHARHTMGKKQKAEITGSLPETPPKPTA